MRGRGLQGISRAVRAVVALTLWIAGLWLGLLTLPTPARANDLDDFQRAVEAYDNHDYANAVALFETLVGDAVPRLQTAALVLESRKYLAASYLFTNQPIAADDQFEALLAQDPNYQIDPLAFPAEVEQAFSVVKARLRRERLQAEAAAARAEAEARREATDRLLADRARNAELLRLAETVRVERVSSRWLAMLPFGVGQFQNGDTQLGYVLAVGQGFLTATTVATWFAHVLLKKEHDRIEADRDVSLAPSEIDRANFQVELARTTNRVSFVLLMSVMAVGIVDAQWRFKPAVTLEQRRPLPEELRSPVALSIGPAALSLRIDL